jgi:predicted transcriptional regulator
VYFFEHIKLHLNENTKQCCVSYAEIIVQMTEFLIKYCLHCRSKMSLIVRVSINVRSFERYTKRLSNHILILVYMDNQKRINLTFMAKLVLDKFVIYMHIM